MFSKSRFNCNKQFFQTKTFLQTNSRLSATFHYENNNFWCQRAIKFVKNKFFIKKFFAVALFLVFFFSAFQLCEAQMQIRLSLSAAVSLIHSA